MRTTKGLLLAALSTLILVSCQKEVDFSNGSGNGNGNGNGNNNIVGNYDFVGMIASTNSVVTMTGAGMNEKTITTSYYITKNNTGTVNITSNKMTTNNFAYEIDTTMHFKMYTDNILVLEDDLPFQMAMPASNGTSNYRTIGSDSLYFESGTVTMGPVGGQSGGTMTSQPSGSKYSWSGDTLILKGSVYQEQTQTQMGMNIKITNAGSQIVKLKKRP